VINANRHRHQHLPTDVTNIAQLCQTQNTEQKKYKFHYFDIQTVQGLIQRWLPCCAYETKQ